MRFLIFTVGALALALVAALFVAPLVINPDDHRQQIVSQLQSATGAEFDIRGKMAFSLLPTPRLDARDLRLVTSVARAEDLLRVDAMRAELSFADLLAGDVVVNELVLIRPTLSLTVNHAGQANWEHWDRRSKPASQAGDAVQVQAVSVSDGVIYYRDTRSDIDQQMSQVHLEISDTGPGGPQKIRGSGVLEKLTTSWDIRVGNRTGTGKWPLSGRITTTDGTIVQAQGNYAPARRASDANATSGEITGRVEVGNPQLGAFLSDLGKLGVALPEMEILQDQELEITANLTLGRDRMDVRDIDMQAQELKAKASVTADWTQPVSNASATLHIERFDLDRLLVGETGNHSDVWARIFGNAKPPLVPDDTDFAGEVRIDLLKLGGRVSRQIVLTSNIHKGVAKISNLSALIPGGGKVTVRGEYKTPAGSPRFNGSMEAKTGNLRSLARMVPGVSDQLPVRLPRSLDMTSDLSFAGDVVQITDIEMQLDHSHISGGVAIALRQRPSFSTNLRIDALNVDKYLRRPVETGTDGGTPSRPADRGASRPVTGILALFDTNTRLHIGRLIMGGTPVRDVSADMTLIGGDLTLRHLSAMDEMGNVAKVSGTMSRPESPSFSFELQASTSDPASLGRYFDQKVPAGIRAQTPLELTSHISGTTESVKLAAAVKLPETTLGINGKIDTPFQAPALDLVAEGQTAVFAETMKVLSPGVTAPGWMAGEASFQFNITEQAAKPRLAGRLDIAGMRLHTDLGIDLTDEDRALEGSIRPLHGEMSKLVETLFPDFTPARSEMGPVEGILEFRGTLDALDLHNVSLAAGPFKFDGRATIAELTGQTPKISVTGIGNRWPLDQLFATASPTVDPTEGGGWSVTPFDLYLPNVAAEVNIALEAMSLAGIDMDNVQLDLEFDKSRLTARHVAGTYLGGKLSGKGIFAVAGLPELSGELSLNDIDLSAFLNAVSGIEDVTGRLNLQTNFNAVGISPYDLTSNLSGLGRLQINDGEAVWRQGTPSPQADGQEEPTGISTESPGDQDQQEKSAFTLSGKFKLNEGVLKPETAFDLTVGERQGTSVGHIHLPKWQVEIEHRLNRQDRGQYQEGKPPTRLVDRITIVGSISRPEIHIENQP